MTDKEKAAAFAGVVVFLAAVAFIAGYPLAVLWAANVFGAGVPYTWRTWLAVLVLISAVRGFRSGKAG